MAWGVSQIIDDFTRTESLSKHHDQESFRQLLQEVLTAPGNQDHHSTTSETTLELNYRLIYVVFKAGVETVTQENPFTNNVQLSEQATQSLAVIEITIRQAPNVVFFSPVSIEPKTWYSGPLYSWLLLKLLVINDGKIATAVRASIYRLLRLVLRLDHKIQPKQLAFHALSKYVQGCIQGIPA